MRKAESTAVDLPGPAYYIVVLISEVKSFIAWDGGDHKMIRLFSTKVKLLFFNSEKWGNCCKTFHFLVEFKFLSLPRLGFTAKPDICELQASLVH